MRVEEGVDGDWKGVAVSGDKVEQRALGLTEDEKLFEDVAGALGGVDWRPELAGRVRGQRSRFARFDNKIWPLLCSLRRSSTHKR